MVKRVVAGDFRARAGRGAAATAPVNIFFVADLTRYDQGPGQPDRRIGDPEVQRGYYYVGTGLIASNIYLFAASQGLAAWFHNCSREAAAKDFKLRSEQRVLYVQRGALQTKPHSCHHGKSSCLPALLRASLRLESSNEKAGTVVR